MNDNILSTATFAMIAAMALAAATAVIQIEMDLQRTKAPVTARAASAPSPGMAAGSDAPARADTPVAVLDIITLPMVTVTGHRAVQGLPEPGMPPDGEVVALAPTR